MLFDLLCSKKLTEGVEILVCIVLNRLCAMGRDLVP